MTALDAALSYIARGWSPVPIPHRSKAPVVRDWQALRIGETEAPRYFNGVPQNVGVILGTASGYLSDADLDCPEAVALGSIFLPPTESTFGRASKPKAHRLYKSDLDKRMAFVDPESGDTLLELRTNGGQTVFPPSVHPSGEAIEWSEDGEPAAADPRQLAAAAGRLAAACVLVRAAPTEDRHSYLLVVAGALVRGLGRDGAAAILAPVARQILGKLYNKSDGARLLDGTAAKLQAGSEIPGWTRLAECIGRKRADAVAAWLSVDRTEHEAEREPARPWHENIRPIAWPSLIGRYAPPRRFVAKDWIPYGCVTSLYGAGGIGKSMAAQLLGTAAALGRYWLGVETDRCRVLALHCEDDQHELWRRQERINAAFGVTMADLADFMPDARTGLENILAHGRDVLQPAELYDQLAAAIAELKPGLVILDNIAQLYGAAENDRALVTQFVNYLARLAQDGDCAVVLLGHVAKAEGSEYSGSTAWDAAVRSRLLLAYEGQGDEKRLFLKKPKANYAETDAIELEWRDGLLYPVNHFDDSPTGKLERGLRDGQANQVFLDALDALRARGMAASESPKAATTYAPRLIVAQGLAGEFTTRDMKLAMDRLFKDSRIKASMAVVKGANRHTKTGIGRVEWEWAAPHTDAPETACATHAPDGCAALHSVPSRGTHCSAHPESLGASHIQAENMCDASEAQMCSAPDADGWEDL